MLTGWVAQNGCKIIDEYIEDPVSGTREDRPRSNEMVARALSKERPYDIIIFWNSARFARNTLYALLIREQLANHGVSLVMLNMNFDETDEEVAALLIPLMHAFDELTSIRIGKEIKRSQRTRAERGEWVGGTPALGYRALTTTRDGKPFKTLEIDPEWAWLAKRMFEQVDEGYPTDRIRRELEHEGIRTRKGAFFARCSILKILHNEGYTGTLIHDGDSTNPRYPPIRFENAWEPLISKETLRPRSAETRRTRTSQREGNLKKSRADRPYQVPQVRRQDECQQEYGKNRLLHL